MTMPQKEQKDTSFLIKLLMSIFGLVAIIVLLLFGWKITKLQILGIELVPSVKSTQSLTVVPINIITNNTLNNLFGTGNWFCFPTLRGAVGIIRTPQDFVIKDPISTFFSRDERDEKSIKYYQGDTVTNGTSGTAYLSYSLPLSECPLEQQAALDNWGTQSSKPITQEFNNSIFGVDNWNCDSDKYSITVNSFPSNWFVQFPFTSAFVNGKHIGVGYAVSDGGSGRLILDTSISKEICP